MGYVRQPAREHVKAIESSRRWADFQHRPDDIFISTPPKSGTTWMQGIVASMLWPDGNPPDPDRQSPWVDVRIGPTSDVLAHLDQQPHRR
jgi:aryl sulfotransferase